MCTEIVARNFYTKRVPTEENDQSTWDKESNILDLFGFFSKPDLTLQDHNPSSLICKTKLNTVWLGCNNLGLCYTSTIQLYLPGTGTD